MKSRERIFQALCDIYTMSALWILTGLRNFWSLHNAKKCKLLYNENDDAVIVGDSGGGKIQI